MMKLTIMALAVTGLVSFCDTAEERAEAHFKSGMELLERGDAERALVEFRNVFKLNGRHEGARLAYARTERERGNIREALGQYLRLVEQYPDNLEGQRALGELSVSIGNWDAARRHATEAARLAPEDPLVRAVNASVAYRDALQGKDEAARRNAVDTARALVSANPDLMMARRVVIDDLLRAQDWTGALAAIDEALRLEPEDRQLFTLRLGVLAQLGEDQEIRTQLERMIALFPDDPNIPATLVRWHMSRGETEAAETFLKQRAETEPREVGAIVTFVRFLAEVRGSEVAREELDRIIATDPPGVRALSALRAGFRFELGERDGAIAELERLVEQSEPSDEQRNIKIVLARMLESTGNQVGARALVEEVLEQDQSNVEALKMRASWLIRSDRTDEAIVALRSALGASPNDAQVMTLMAQAHERAGNRELMAEMLARAVEASNRAPEESLRYARYLLSEQNLRSAESVLLEAVRLAPDNAGLLGGLGEVYVGMRDWPRLTQVIETLERQENAEARRLANELTARRLAAQNREEELMGFLKDLADDGPQGIGAAAAIVRARLAQGDTEGALAYALRLTEQEPDDRNTRFLYASTLAVTGALDEAAQLFRTLADEVPQESRNWLSLHKIRAVQGQREESVNVLLEGLTHVPDDFRLNWALAGIREREGDIDAAIAIYDRLYAADSGNMIIANNLASLLSTWRQDAGSLDRAHKIARRLRDRNVPAFQDTYGWIAFRRGDYDTALSHLEPAAEALTGEPSVQYHLAKTYVALERNEDALVRFRRVREIVGEGTRPAFMDDVDAEIERLSAGSGGTEEQN